MDNYLLFEKLSGHRTDDTLNFFVNKFDKLLIKYANKLKYEDAYNDLLVYFLELIKNLNTKIFSNTNDGAIVNYIKISMYHEYILLSKKQSNIISHEYLIPDKELTIEDIAIQFDDMSALYYTDMNKHLNKKEYNVVLLLFVQRLSINEASMILDESKWNIYKLKTSALNKLRIAYKESL